MMHSGRSGSPYFPSSAAPIPFPLLASSPQETFADFGQINIPLLCLYALGSRVCNLPSALDQWHCVQGVSVIWCMCSVHMSLDCFRISFAIVVEVCFGLQDVIELGCVIEHL